MPLYRKRDNLIYNLHPFTALVFTGVSLLLALLFSHPFYLLSLLMGVGLVIVTAGNWREWKVYLRFSLFMLGAILVVNAIFGQVGKTVLFWGPFIPGLGPFRLTLEALSFGFGMGLRLLVIMSTFCFYTCVVNPDKVLKLLSPYGNRSVVIMSMATRFFPLLVEEFQRITEVQRCRGVKLDTGNWWQRAKNLLPVMNILLLSCLERSQQVAEAMQARGYGSGSRTVYSPDLWRPRDYLIFAALFTGLVTGIWAVLAGWASYSYYPELESLNPAELRAAVVIMLTTASPALLNWGWAKWQTLKLKI